MQSVSCVGMSFSGMPVMSFERGQLVCAATVVAAAVGCAVTRGRVRSLARVRATAAAAPAPTTSRATAAGKVAVYLGASQPVHGTHVAMVRALLDAGHATVFVFLLRWRPERFGTSADASSRTLRGWLDTALGAEESAQRVVIMPLQRDSEGAALMRAHLGHGADPEVQICYSRKYSSENFRSRIENEWMPLYRSEFARARHSTRLVLQPPCHVVLLGTRKGSRGSAAAGLHCQPA